MMVGRGVMQRMARCHSCGPFVGDIVYKSSVRPGGTSRQSARRHRNCQAGDGRGMPQLPGQWRISLPTSGMMGTIRQKLACRAKSGNIPRAEVATVTS